MSILAIKHFQCLFNESSMNDHGDSKLVVFNSVFHGYIGLQLFGDNNLPGYKAHQYLDFLLMTNCRYTPLLPVRIMVIDWSSAVSGKYF